MKRIVAGLAVVVLILGYLLFHTYQTSKNEIERLSLNLANYNLKVSTLTMTNKELKQELEKGNEVIVKTDSILKSRDKKISQLERVIATKITIKDTDTTFLTIEKGIPVFLEKPYTVYKANFKDVRSCITIEGFILSSDPYPSLAITKREATITSYNIDTNRRWWQFWKPKTEKIVESECGEVSITEIKK